MTIAVTTIDPKDNFHRDYVVKFKRGILDQRKFSISLDCEYNTTLSKQLKRSSNTITFSITPSPVILSFIAVFFGLLGAALNYTITSTTVSDPLTYLVGISNILMTNKGITAAIISLVFFNVYEQTKIGQNLKIGVDWRAALLIGILSGLGGERIVASLKALIGIT